MEGFRYSGRPFCLESAGDFVENEGIPLQSRFRSSETYNRSSRTASRKEAMKFSRSDKKLSQEVLKCSDLL